MKKVAALLVICIGMCVLAKVYAQVSYDSAGAYLSLGIQPFQPIGTHDSYEWAASIGIGVNARIYSGFFMGLEGMVIFAQSSRDTFSGFYYFWPCMDSEWDLAGYDVSKIGLGGGLKLGWAFPDAKWRISAGAGLAYFFESSTKISRSQVTGMYYNQGKGGPTVNNYFLDYSVLLNYSWFGIGYSRLRGILFTFGLGL